MSATLRIPSHRDHGIAGSTVGLGIGLEWALRGSSFALMALRWVLGCDGVVGCCLARGWASSTAGTDGFALLLVKTVDEDLMHVEFLLGVCLV